MDTICLAHFPTEERLRPADIIIKTPPGIKAEVTGVSHGRVTEAKLTINIGGMDRCISIDMTDREKARKDIFMFSKLYRREKLADHNIKRCIANALKHLKASRLTVPEQPVERNQWVIALKEDKLYDKFIRAKLSPFCLLRDKLRAYNRRFLTIDASRTVDLMDIPDEKIIEP